MQLKNNDSFLRASLSRSFSFSPHSPSLYICFSRSLSRLSPIKNFKCRFLPLDRSVCPILLTDVLPSLFSAASVSLPPSSRVSPSHPHKPSLFRNRCGSLVWHRSVRSNLINSCKFNYWLTAPRLRALYLLLASPRASISSCPVFLFFSIPFFSFTAPRTNPSRRSPFLRNSPPAFSFSAELCGGNAIARKW